MTCTRTAGAARTGFTLVEMAIIVIIIGIIAALVIPAITSRIVTDRGAQGRGDVVSVRDEIIGFAMMQQPIPRLPVARVVGGNATSYIDAGDLARLPRAQAGDFWGQEFMYRVANAANDQEGNPLSADGALCNAIANNVTTNLSVQRGGVTTPNVAFIVKSKGPNMQSDVPTFMINNVEIPATGKEINGRAFDDIVEFVILEHLRGRIPCPPPTLPPGVVHFPDYGFPDGQIVETGASGAYSWAQSVSGGIRTVELFLNENLQLTIRSRAQITYSQDLSSLGIGAVGRRWRGRLESNTPLYFIFPVSGHTSFAVDLVQFSDANDRATIHVYNGASAVGLPYTLSGAPAHPDPVRICVTPSGGFDRFSITSTNDYTFGVRAVFAPAPTDGPCHINL